MSTARLNFLKERIHHPLPSVRYQAVRALGEDGLGASDVIELLQHVLHNDSSAGVRDAAAVVLADFGIQDNRPASTF